MKTLSFDYKPKDSSKEYNYNLLVKDSNVENQTISGYVVSRLEKDELEAVTAGVATKEINKKAYRTFNVDKINNLKVS